MASTDWESNVAAKQQSARQKISNEWLLPASISDTLQKPLAEHSNHVLQMAIPRKSGLLSDRELTITENYTVGELLKRLREGELSSIEVTVAFSKRAAVAQQLLLCLTETYFPEAQNRARFLDSDRAQGRIMGPLHSLPISLKDGFQIAGSAASIGFVSFLDRMSETNSPLVDVLLDLGAVVYVKTNVPQTMMTADSHNNIFGRTLNPHNTIHTAGGSSGGEGALVAFRGSPLGIGTDVAGSIRIPSLCCGTYGFKPTTSRIPYGGQLAPVRDGMSFFLPSAGPLANDMEALNILCRAVMGARPALYDSTALDIPWRYLPPAPSALRLRLGVLGEDPVFPLHPPVVRALVDAVKILEAQGHEIVQIPMERAHVANALALAFAYFSLDDTPFSHIAASGEPIILSIIQGGEDFARFRSQSHFLDDIKSLEGVPWVAALNVKRHMIAEEWRSLWKEKGLDGVIGPGAQNTAVRHDTYGLPPYTLLLNVLDYPACMIPFGKASSELDPEPLSMTRGRVGPDYEPSAVHGAPTAIQVFTNRMRDEECLRVAGIVDECLNGVMQTGKAREHNM